MPERSENFESSIPETQTMTVVAKAIVHDNSTAILLVLLGHSATKLWNNAILRSREVWESTGRILSSTEFDNELKLNCTNWYRSLHSQSSQAILEEIGISCRSWFTLRKSGNKLAKPPGFRKKGALSAVTFKQQAAVWNPLTETVRLGIPKEVYGRQFIYVRLQLLLQMYLPKAIGAFWSSGCLAQPAVNRFAWRKTCRLYQPITTGDVANNPAASATRAVRTGTCF